MSFVYKYNSPRGYYLTKHGTFQVRTTQKGINQAHGTYKTEDEAYQRFLQLKRRILCTKETLSKLN